MPAAYGSLAAGYWLCQYAAALLSGGYWVAGFVSIGIAQLVNDRLLFTDTILAPIFATIIAHEIRVSAGDHFTALNPDGI